MQPGLPDDPLSAELTQPLTPVRPQAPAGRDQSIGRASSMMAVANLTSRVTGFLRQVALASVLGFEVLQDSYTISNTLPNIIYELLIGGVLSSVLIPLLVRAQAEDADGGETYTRRLLTLTGMGLLVATAVALAAAAWLTPLYIEAGSHADPDLAIRLAYLLLPQIFFYGIGAIFGAILNSRGAFGAFAWAPVLNNVVMLAVLGAYVLVPDPDTQLLVLGVGTTLGIVVQTLVLIPSVRRSGFRYRPVWGWDPRLRAVGGRAGWTVLYVLAGQVGYVVLTRVATGSDAGALSIYNTAWLLLQVPYGVLGVSLLTALMPRMSRAAAAGRFDDVVADLSLGSRMAAVLLIPVAGVFTAFGPEIGTALFAWRSSNAEGAQMLGTTLAVSAFGLAPFAITLLQTRVFYAMTDNRTPFFVQLFTVAVKVALMLLCPLLLPSEQVVLGLAAANSLSFIAGAALGQVLLRRRLGRLPTGAILATAGRALVATALGAGAARGVLALLDTEPMQSLTPFGRAWTSVFLAVVLGGPLIVLVMRVLRVREVDPLLRRIDRIADRLRARRGPPR